MIHRGIGRRADNNQRVAGIANHQHEHAEQHGVLHAGGDQRLLLAGVAKDEPEGCEYDDADDEGRPSPTIEGDTEHTYGEQEGQVLYLLPMALGLSLIDGPDDTGYKQYDIDNLAGIERHAERIDKEQLEPSAYGDDAGHDTIEHGCQDHDGDA